jgi:Ca-activated chloride channel family protein
VQSRRRADATLTRCFLLTDGLANVGLTDLEQIAAQAAGVRTHAGVGTSTFGIGDDYAESLLGPMAVAGGGQFHHLRTPVDIARTFLGELAEMLCAAALNVLLERTPLFGMLRSPRRGQPAHYRDERFDLVNPGGEVGHPPNGPAAP